MNRLFLLIFVLSSQFTFGQNFRVAIATYTTAEMPDAIREAEISGIFRKIDQNKLYHYYKGDYFTEAEAEEVRLEMLRRGFIDAKIIDLEEQKLWCGSPCPYFVNDFVYNHIGADGLMVGSVFFLRKGDATVSREGSKTIFEFAKVLKNNPSFRLHLGGHTDKFGSADYNIYIANKRVLSVISKLRMYGVPRFKISPIIFGEGMPLGGDPKYDRRVVLTIIDSSGQVVSRNRATVAKPQRVLARKR